MNSSNLSHLLISGRIALGAFDFDGNILAPDTKYYVIDRETGQEVEITAHELDQHPEWITGEGARYRWHENFLDSVRLFRDYHSDPNHTGPDGLKADVEKALKDGKFSPSIYNLIKIFLVPARLFAIITARSHTPDNLVRIMWIISEDLLTEEEKAVQFDNIRGLYRALYDRELRKRDDALRFYFEEIMGSYTVSNIQLAKQLGILGEKSMSKRKVEAMKHYIQDINDRILIPIGMGSYPRSIGFSDDGVANIEAMLTYFQNEKKRGNYKDDKIRLYFTGRKGDYEKFIELGLNTEEKENVLIIRI